MRKTLEAILALLARAVVWRQKPLIIGVTGSVGKTSAKEAIRAVVSVDRSVRAAPKNYNNEIGLPMAIIGGRAPGRSPLRWIAAIARGKWYAAVRGLRYPEALVLEYGADHPGDLGYLLRIARPHIGIVTAVGPAHTEFFRTVDRVVGEKRKLVAALGKDDIAVLNRDDERVFAMASRTRARVVTYGFHVEADVRASEFQVTFAAAGGAGSIPTGVAFKLAAGGSTVPVHLRGVLGVGHVGAALAGAATGVALGMHLVEISHALEQYEAPPGRLRILSGIKSTTLLDDTYNSSPLAVAVALEALEGLAGFGRTLAVLGDMLELGPLTEHEHEHIGQLTASRNISHLICVGEASRFTARGARAAGMPEDRVLEFARAEDAGRFVQDLLRPGDIVLVKGSQGMRLERVVRELMAEPLRAGELLCRQDAEWERR